MKLDEKTVLSAIRYWSKRYNFLFKWIAEDEFFNIAYTGRIQKVDNPKHMNSTIRWDMIDYLRKEKRRRVESLTSREDLLVYNEEVNRLELSEQLNHLMSEADLPERSKIILVLYYYRGKNFREISSLTGFSLGTVSILHKDAIQKLRIIAYEHYS